MGDYGLNDMPSLASATSTNVDSACKHIQQCRVSQDHMSVLAMGDENDMMRNKYRYCVHKDEFVLGIGKPWHRDEKKFSNNAYPRVLSNLGKLGDTDASGHAHEAVKLIKYMYHNATSIPSRNDLLTRFNAGLVRDFPNHPAIEPYFEISQDNTFDKMRESVKYVHDFNATGYANTLGWAHAHHGDTMSSVMIGGLRTVKNGDFEVYCGDLIQWYWPFERDCFTQSGKRKPVVAGLTNVDPASTDTTVVRDSRDVTIRKNFYDREYGQPSGSTKTVAYIKPYKRDDETPRMYDWYRVFGTAISSARPHEKVDIRIQRQCL